MDFSENFVSSPEMIVIDNRQPNSLDHFNDNLI